VRNVVHQTNSRATAPSLEHIAKQSIGCGLRHIDHQTVCCRTLVVDNKLSCRSQDVLFYVQLRHDRPTDSRRDIDRNWRTIHARGWTMVLSWQNQTCRSNTSQRWNDIFRQLPCRLVVRVFEHSVWKRCQRHSLENHHDCSGLDICWQHDSNEYESD
jgi:hypothetical protein